ncbi:MAG: hypothetical protein ACI81S_002152 [Sphingobacteriales bacterium]|jgi:hypothetical protein
MDSSTNMCQRRHITSKLCKGRANCARRIFEALCFKGVSVKIKDSLHDFISLTDNKKLWEDVLNTSERNAVLIAGAAFDTQLERLLKKYLIEDSPVSDKIAVSSVFASKINLCYSLGILTDDERHDLNLLRDIRNAFAHNIFGCDFDNVQVKAAISNMICPKKAKANAKVVPLRTCFNIGMIILDGFLKTRLETIQPVKKLANIKFANEA